jgi:hypothetical protein
LDIFLPVDSEVPRIDNVMFHYSTIAWSWANILQHSLDQGQGRR